MANNIFQILKSSNNTKFDATIENDEETIEKKKYSPRDIIIALFTKEILPEHIINSSTQYSQFMINRFLASTKNFKNFEYIEIANELNTKKMSNKMHYDLLYKLLPKKDKVYPGYAWNKKDDSLGNKEEIIKALRWKYKYNERGAEYAIMIIPKEEIKELLEEYKNYISVTG